MNDDGPSVKHNGHKEPHTALLFVYGLAIGCFVLWTWSSYARWADFAFRTFDLAYYVQAIWQLIHGRTDVTVENVPLLGNHVEPIIFLFAPIFGLVSHPLLFVVLQNAALAAMAPIAYATTRRLGFAATPACLLAAVILVTPATTYIALHEFHPEALAAPCLALLLYARLAKAAIQHWLWFVLTLACKENMAVLLGTYCVVFSILERKRSWKELFEWYLAPMVLAVGWLLICSFLITPTFNAGKIDYLSLYNYLGSSPAEILTNALAKPQLVLKAIRRALSHGNLVSGLLLPFLGLPLLRPRWLFISAPILLQHLLSWRSSEWMIYFHYAAPLLPLFWIAAVEALAALQSKAGMMSRLAPAHQRPLLPLVLPTVIPWLLLAACLITQFSSGSVLAIARDTRRYLENTIERERKRDFLAQIPNHASIVAPLPYLSHLAMREQVYSLHYIFKGLKTLSRQSYEPPPVTDFVLIDYKDSATFDSAAGYYHPVMKTVDNRIIRSSDQLLNDFLGSAAWQVQEVDELTLFRRAKAGNATGAKGNAILRIGEHTTLMGVEKSGDILSPHKSVKIRLIWNFTGPRDVIPWMLLRLSHAGSTAAVLTKGLCAPEIKIGHAEELWQVTYTSDVAPGEYRAEAIFIDNTKRNGNQLTPSGEGQVRILAKPIALGNLRITPAD